MVVMMMLVMLVGVHGYVINGGDAGGDDGGCGDDGGESNDGGDDDVGSW
jgi:hypothetical protein